MAIIFCTHCGCDISDDEISQEQYESDTADGMTYGCEDCVDSMRGRHLEEFDLDDDDDEDEAEDFYL